MGGPDHTSFNPPPPPTFLNHPTHRLVCNRFPGMCASRRPAAKSHLLFSFSGWPRMIWSHPPRFILFLSSSSRSIQRMWMLRRCDLRWLHGAVVMVAGGDGETQCSKVRSDIVLDGPSLRSQKTTGPCGLSNAETATTIHILSSSPCAAFREHKRLTNDLRSRAIPHRAGCEDERDRRQDPHGILRFCQP